MLKARSVTKALESLGYDSIELHNGGNYWYFVGGVADDFDCQGVYVRNLNSIPLSQWVCEFEHKVSLIRK